MESLLGHKNRSIWKDVLKGMWFLGKIGRFPGEIRGKGCLMSGAAARTGELRK